MQTVDLFFGKNRIRAWVAIEKDDLIQGLSDVRCKATYWLRLLEPLVRANAAFGLRFLLLKRMKGCCLCLMMTTNMVFG